MKHAKQPAVWAAMLIMLFAAGCRSTPETDCCQLPQLDSAMQKRAETLAAVWKTDDVRAVVLRESALSLYRKSRDTLAAQMKAQAVNYCYIAVETEECLGDRREDLTEMIVALGRAGIRCDLVLLPHFFLPTRSEMIFGRIGGLSDPFASVWKRALKLNRDLPDEYPLAGITIWCGLDRLTASNESLPPGQLYRWNEDDYGIGSDNDLMMQDFMKTLAVYKEEVHAKNLNFSIAIPSLYHVKAAAGELSCGKTEDFLKLSDRLIVLGSGTKPSFYRQSFRSPMTGITGKKILCAMVLSGHISENSGALRRRDWADFVKILGYMHDGLGGQPGYGGMVLMPYQSVELLLER